jgi:hypothetical protein
MLNSDQNEKDAEVHFVCEILISFHISATVEIVKVSHLHQEELLNKRHRHVTRMADTLNIDIYKVLVGELYGNRPLKDQGVRWNENSKFRQKYPFLPGDMVEFLPYHSVKKLRGCSPPANYTDRATAACQRS